VRRDGTRPSDQRGLAATRQNSVIRSPTAGHSGSRNTPVKRPIQSRLVAAALLALGWICACKGNAESLGANCLTPKEACSGKACGATCLACSTGSATPDVSGTCGADGVCALGWPSCGPVPNDGATGGDVQGDTGDAAARCGKAGAATGVQTGQSITVAGQKRTYVLSVPTGYTGTTPLALVLVWHGANLNGSLARSLFNLESKSNGAAIFVYPDGLAAGTWDTSSGSADLQLFTALVDSISSDYCIDAHRIFSTGHSTGAIMTNALGCSYAPMLRAIAPVAGTSPGTAGRTCTGKVAALIAHGENDPLMPFSQGQATRDFFISQNGCTTRTATWAPETACVEYQGCQPDLPVVWCVHDGGHSWPSLSFGCDGGICIDGGAAIWAFFASFH
jgi:poly(3-hydroxybutyrate) depolymerase